VVRKKGGRNRRAHVNRLKFFDPMNSLEDPEVQITVEDDEPDIISQNPSNKDNNNEKNKEKQQQQKQQQQQPPQQLPYSPLDNKRITRSTTNKLPDQISRYSSYGNIQPYQEQNYILARFNIDKKN
jgi:hypothetical protein